MTFSPYFNQRDPQHVMSLCAGHAAEFVAKGWAPGFGTLGRCELPDFCAACRYTDAALAAAGDPSDSADSGAPGGAPSAPL